MNDVVCGDTDNGKLLLLGTNIVVFTIIYVFTNNSTYFFFGRVAAAGQTPFFIGFPERGFRINTSTPKLKISTLGVNI